MKFSSLFLALLLLFPALLGADSVTFAYSGRVRVQGTPFDGTGNFKFAIVSNNGMNTYWSNDGSSSDGSEPADSIAINVVDGNFSVNVGDTSLGMEPINRTVFNQPNQIKLRLWFSDGSLGFEHLLPDANLNNVDLLGQVSDDDPTVIFVDGTLGSDDNDGLTMATAKQTINGAMEIVPARLKADVRIKIAPGEYPERVSIFGINSRSGTFLILEGDETWTPSMGGAPNVEINAADIPSVPSVSADHAIAIDDSSKVILLGLHVRYGRNGIFCDRSSISLERCLLSDNGIGLYGEQSRVHLTDTVATNNGSGFGAPDGSGIWLCCQSSGFVQRSAFTDNQWSGVYATTSTSLQVIESGEASGNGGHGYNASYGSQINFGGGFSGLVENNAVFGVLADLESFTVGASQNTFLNNGLGDIDTSFGGANY